MLLVAAAFAEDRTWDCPALDSPAEALAYVPDDDLGVTDAVDTAYAEAMAWFDASCEVECTESADAPEYCEYYESSYYGCDCERVACTTASGAEIDWTRTWWWESDTHGDWGERSEVVNYTVVPPAGATEWSSLTFRQATYAESATTWISMNESTTSVEWGGVLREDWPVDGRFEASTTDGWDSPYRRVGRGWADPSCAWDVQQYAEHTTFQRFTFDGHTLEVEDNACGERGAYVAYRDGEPWGQVDEGWEWLAGTDADGDGFPAEGGLDCDDSDAAANTCAEEVYYDGADEDCDGDDDYDADGDGYTAIAAGGDDCDDTERSTHPGARDVAYDGVDANCAGDSDYDRDRDGYDRVSWGGDDCNDDDPSVHPGATEYEGDGIDNDCAGGDAAEDVSGTRCGTGTPISGIWLGVILMLGLRGRQARPRAHGGNRAP